jgi:hypothetical protein
MFLIYKSLTCVDLKIKKIEKSVAKFEAFTAVKIQGKVFWVVTPCSVEVGYTSP